MFQLNLRWICFEVIECICCITHWKLQKKNSPEVQLQQISYTLFYISIELIFLSKYFSCCRNIVLMKISKKPNLSKRLRALMKCNGKGHWILSKVHNIKAHVQSNWKIRIKEILILDLDSTCASKVGALRAPYFIHDWIWF